MTEKYPAWLQDLMDLLDLDLVEKASWVRKWNASFPDGLDPDAIAEEELGSRVLVQAWAQECGIGFVDLDRIEIDKEALHLVSRELVTRTRSIPVKKDECTVWLAISDPRDMKALDAMKEVTGCRVVPLLALHSEIEKAIERYFPVGGNAC